MRVVLEGDRCVMERQRIRNFSARAVRRLESASGDALRCLRGRPSDSGLANATGALRRTARRGTGSWSPDAVNERSIAQGFLGEGLSLPPYVFFVVNQGQRGIHRRVHRGHRAENSAPKNGAAPRNRNVVTMMADVIGRDCRFREKTPAGVPFEAQGKPALRMDGIERS